MQQRPTAFSLVELSIVLVILGLLVGGILAGQSLIRASELRAVTSEYSRYSTAALSFRDKYFSWPGLMQNATQFWGRQNGNNDCITNSAAAIAAPGACDSSGVTERMSGSSNPSNPGRTMQFWRHMVLGGVIEGNYSGLSGPLSNTDAILGVNIPASKLNGAGWIAPAGPVPPATGTADNFQIADYGNSLFIGGATTGSSPTAPIMRPEEAWNIDTKMDDGKPARGKVIAKYWNDACATPDDATTFTNTNLNSSYKLTDSANRCALFFIRQFH